MVNIEMIDKNGKEHGVRQSDSGLKGLFKTPERPKIFHEREKYNYNSVMSKLGGIDPIGSHQRDMGYIDKH